MFTPHFLLFLQFFSPLSKVKEEQQNGVLELVDVNDERRYMLLISPDSLTCPNWNINYDLPVKRKCNCYIA